MLSTPDRVWFRRSFIGDRDLQELRDRPLPLHAELHDLPPALFTVGDLDPLLDDSQFMAARWQSAGNRAELRVWPESIHGFTAFPSRLPGLPTTRSTSSYARRFRTSPAAAGLSSGLPESG